MKKEAGIEREVIYSAILAFESKCVTRVSFPLDTFETLMREEKTKCFMPAA